MIIRSKAPLRLGLAGGGTDVSPYSDEYGGYVLNATIDMYAHCTLETTDDDKIVIHAADTNECFASPSLSHLEIDGKLSLQKGVYNRVVKDYNRGQPLSFKMTTYSDALAGSGLGSSSTMVVSILNAFVEWLNLPFGDYDVAHLAYRIEREDLGLSGGKQDQYAATFGGFNFMEFFAQDRVIVNPLRVKDWIINELEAAMILYFTGISRNSEDIIDEQKRNVLHKDQPAIEAMHRLKEGAVMMKEALLKGDIKKFAGYLGESWLSKKEMASSITNDRIEQIYREARSAGALAGKISGAGGGGFMMLIVDTVRRLEVIKALSQFSGKTYNFHFTDQGAFGWKML